MSILQNRTAARGLPEETRAGPRQGPAGLGQVWGIPGEPELPSCLPDTPGEPIEPLKPLLQGSRPVFLTPHWSVLPQAAQPAKS